MVSAYRAINTEGSSFLANGEDVTRVPLQNIMCLHI